MNWEWEYLGKAGGKLQRESECAERSNSSFRLLWPTRWARGSWARRAAQTEVGVNGEMRFSTNKERRESAGAARARVPAFTSRDLQARFSVLCSDCASGPCTLCKIMMMISSDIYLVLFKALPYFISQSALCVWRQTAPRAHLQAVGCQVLPPSLQLPPARLRP